MEYTAKQMMAVALSRQIEDGKTYIIGTGLPLIGGTLAKNTHAPNAHLIFETALFEGNPQEVPTSVSDLRINYQASVLWPQYRYFGFQALAARNGAIAAGFLGCQSYVAEAFGVEQTPRTVVATASGSYATSVPGVFTAGDMHRGQSLVVWAIREGREAARAVDQYLMGYTNLE